MFVSRSLHSDHADLIHDIAYDFYGRRMATCSSDQMIKIWDLSANGDWTCTAQWRCHLGSAWRVTWAHPEFGQVIATCSFDRTIVIWEEVPGSGRQQQLSGGGDTATIPEGAKAGQTPGTGTAAGTGSAATVPAAKAASDGEPEKSGTGGSGGAAATPATGGTATTATMSNWVRRATLVDPRTSVTGLQFAPRHLNLQLAAISTDGLLRIYEALDVMNLTQWQLQFDFPTRTNGSCLAWSQSRIDPPLLAVGSALPGGASSATTDFSDGLICASTNLSVGGGAGGGGGAANPPGTTGGAATTTTVTSGVSGSAATSATTATGAGAAVSNTGSGVGGSVGCPGTGATGFQASAAQQLGRLMIYEYSESRRYWDLVEDVRLPPKDEAVYDLQFAPHMGQSFQTLAVASHSELFILRIRLADSHPHLAGAAAGTAGGKGAVSSSGPSSAHVSSFPSASSLSSASCASLVRTPTSYDIKLVARFDHHRGRVWRVSWNVTGSLLASSGDDGCVRLWQANYLGVWLPVSVINPDGTPQAVGSSPSPGLATLIPNPLVVTSDNHRFSVTGLMPASAGRSPMATVSTAVAMATSTAAATVAATTMTTTTTPASGAMTTSTATAAGGLTKTSSISLVGGSGASIGGGGSGGTVSQSEAELATATNGGSKTNLFGGTNSQQPVVWH